MVPLQVAWSIFGSRAPAGLLECLLEAFPEFLDMPSSILPLPDLSILVGDRSLRKVFDVDIHGNYRGVFFEHPDLINCEAMVHDGEHVYIMDALGGWVFKTDLDGLVYRVISSIDIRITRLLASSFSPISHKAFASWSGYACNRP